MKKKKKTNAIDKAFLGSDKHTLDDLKLQPWTPDRIIQFQNLGGLYPNLGKEGWAQFRRTNVYPGAVADMSIFLYLSTLKPDEVNSATRQEAITFGIKRGLHKTDSAVFWDTYNKFFEIQGEIEASATKPKGDDHNEPDDEPGNE